MAKVYNNFEFTSKLEILNDTEKFKAYKKHEASSGWINEELMINARNEDSAVLVSLKDGYYKQANYTFERNGIGEKNEDGSWKEAPKIKVNWNDRKNQTIIDKVANYQKYVLDFSNNKERYDLRIMIEKLENKAIQEEEKNKLIEECENTYKTSKIDELKTKLKELEGLRYEFLSRVDMIEVFKKEFPKYKDLVFKTTGNLTFSEWKGNVYRNFEVKKIEKALDTDKRILKADIDLYFNSESLDESLFEDTKKYIINAYTKSYDGQLKKEIFLPIALIMDASRLDLENKKHKGKVDFLINPLRVEDDNTYYQLQYNVKITRGAEKKEITIDDLTDFQRSQVEVGLKTLEQIKKDLGGNKFGDRVDEIRLININTKDFQNGAEETDLTIDDFIIKKEEDNEQVENTNTTTNNEEIENNTQEEDLDDLI